MSLLSFAEGILDIMKKISQYNTVSIQVNSCGRLLLSFKKENVNLYLHNYSMALKMENDGHYALDEKTLINHLV
jgi:hypothetical protein